MHPAAMTRPSGRKARVDTVDACLIGATRSRPVAGSQSRRPLSSPPEATVSPSGEKATAQASAPWLAKASNATAGRIRHTDTSWSPPRKRLWPSRAKDMNWKERRPSKAFSFSPVASRQTDTGIVPPGCPSPRRASRLPSGVNAKVERPGPHRIERDDRTPPARRHVAYADLTAPPEGDQRRPVGGEDQPVGTHRGVGVDPRALEPRAGPR